MQLTIDLPPALRLWIDQRLADGDYADASDYLRDLVRRDRSGTDHDVAVARVQAMIDEGIASGLCGQDAVAVLDEVIAGIR